MPVLSTKDIPKELWANNAIHIPEFLCIQYRNLLDKYQLMQQAADMQDQGKIYGGQSEQDAKKYFARRYGVSTCRVESLIIDPSYAFGRIPDDLISSLSGGMISVLDIACGSGAAVVSLLCTITVLRLGSRLPKLPLNIHVTGADYSQPALDIYEELFNELQPAYKSVGIEAVLKTKLWDAEQSHETSSLLDDWFQSCGGTEEFLVVAANFSGVANNVFVSFEKSFQHIYDRLSNKQCVMIWVEPRIKGAQTLFEKLKQILINSAPWQESSQEPPMSYDHNWFHPIQNRILPCRILVKEYHRL